MGGGIEEVKVVTKWGCVGIVDDGGGRGTKGWMNDGQNSHSRNLLQSFLGRWVNGWYVVHKICMYNNALVVQLVEHSFVVWLC